MSRGIIAMLARNTPKIFMKKVYVWKNTCPAIKKKSIFSRHIFYGKAAKKHPMLSHRVFHYVLIGSSADVQTSPA